MSFRHAKSGYPHPSMTATLPGHVLVGPDAEQMDSRLLFRRVGKQLGCSFKHQNESKQVSEMRKVDEVTRKSRTSFVHSRGVWFNSQRLFHQYQGTARHFCGLDLKGICAQADVPMHLDPAGISSK